MKKPIIALLCMISIIPAFAQDSGSGSSSGFRLGIKVSPNISWLRPDDPKLGGNGAKVKFGVGLITEFKIGKNYSFATGISFPSLSGGNLKFATDSIYYVPANDTVNFYITSRQFNLQYVELPIMLKLKTNEVGYFTYFGQIGANVGFRTKARATDKGTVAGSTSSVEVSDVDILKDIQIFKVNLVIEAGAEYNISGNTSLMFGLGYNYGVTNILKKDSEFLKTKTGQAFSQKANLDQVVLNLGVLF